MIDDDRHGVTVRGLERQRYAAMLAADTETLVSLCHPRLLYTHSHAKRDTLEQQSLELATAGSTP